VLLVCGNESVTVTVNVFCDSVTVAVPLMVPVVVSKVSPLGSVGLIENTFPPYPHW